jgi:hypothetical protein
MQRLPLFLAPALVAAMAAGMASAANDPEQAAIDGCIDRLARNGSASASNGQIVDTMFSEAGTMVYLEDADGRVWQCLGYRDGNVASLEPAAAAEAEEALARAAEKAARAPERVQFAAGTTSSTITRTIEAGGATDFVLGAREGQNLEVSLAPQTGKMYYFIKVPDGSLLIQGTDAGTSFDGTLPTSGDYLIEVVNKESAPISFDLEIEIC